jgi:hypothetical protein
MAPRCRSTPLLTAVPSTFSNEISRACFIGLDRFGGLDCVALHVDGFALHTVSSRVQPCDDCAQRNASAKLPGGWRCDSKMSPSRSSSPAVSVTSAGHLRPDCSLAIHLSSAHSSELSSTRCVPGFPEHCCRNPRSAAVLERRRIRAYRTGMNLASSAISEIWRPLRWL